MYPSGISLAIPRYTFSQKRIDENQLKNQSSYTGALSFQV